MENKNFNILIFILYRINNMPITKSFIATAVVCGIMIGFFSFFSWILFFSDVPGAGFIFLALVALCAVIIIKVYRNPKWDLIDKKGLDDLGY